jgi:SSS family transporter
MVRKRRVRLVNEAGIIVILYSILAVIIGIITSKYVKTIEDFIVAGRKLGPWLVALSFNSTALSGWLILGVSGWVYRQGYQAAWTLWGSGAFAVLASYLILGKYIRRFSKITNSLTIPDMLEIRYYDQKRHILRWISAIIIFISTVIYIGGLEATLAKAFKYVFGIGAVESVILGSAVVIVYVLLGGILAAVWTDVLQGALMVITSIMLLIVGFQAGGGLDLFSKVDAMAVKDPNIILTPWQSPSVILYGISLILFASILSYMGQPQLLNKFMGARDDPTIRKASLISLITQIVLFIGVLVAGFAARVVWPSASMLPNKDTELAAPFLIENYAGGIALGILWAGVLAAVMSSADSLTIMATSSIVNDLYYKIFRPNASPKQLVNLSRIVTLLIGILGIIVAFQPLLLLWSIWLGWSGLAVFITLLLPGLFWKRATRESAIIALIVSFIVGMLWFYFGLQNILHITMPSLLAGFAIVIIVSYLTKEPPKEISELVEKIKRGH